MRRNVNKLVRASLDSWKERNRPDIYSVGVSDRGYRVVSTSLFECIEVDKCLLGYLTTLGLDGFKRGTIEAKRCVEALATATRADVEASPQVGKSMWD